MPKDPNFIPQKLRPWIEARARFKLSHAQVQMGRELALNPAKLGRLANDNQEPWKLPLPLFIEACYKKQFSKDVPDDTRSIEAKERARQEKKREKKKTKPEPQT